MNRELNTIIKKMLDPMLDLVVKLRMLDPLNITMLYPLKGKRVRGELKIIKPRQPKNDPSKRKVEQIPFTTQDTSPKFQALEQSELLRL